MAKVNMYVHAEPLPDNKAFIDACLFPEANLILWQSYKKNLPVIEGKKVRVYYNVASCFTRDDVIKFATHFLANHFPQLLAD